MGLRPKPWPYLQLEHYDFYFNAAKAALEANKYFLAHAISCPIFCVPFFIHPVFVADKGILNPLGCI